MLNEISASHLVKHPVLHTHVQYHGDEHVANTKYPYNRRLNRNSGVPHECLRIHPPPAWSSTRGQPPASCFAHIPEHLPLVPAACGLGRSSLSALVQFIAPPTWYRVPLATTKQCKTSPGVSEMRSHSPSSYSCRPSV